MIRIAHLADIHIQNRRRDEYRGVFAELYAALRREAPAVIAVVGDVFDDKMRASAHNLADVAGFLSALADVAPVVLIAGNHDTNVLQPGALDLLTPLLADHQHLQPPRLTYWRQSGVYRAHDIVWHVKAPDGPLPGEDPVSGEDRAPRVCLFHEELNGALLPNGQRLRDFSLSLADLAGFDAALGGHIHLRQRLGGGRVGYCGSLVQQNIGERHTGHGFVVWDLQRSAEHPPFRTAPPAVRGVDIPNRLGGFLRVKLSAEGVDQTPQPLPAPLYWELVHDAKTPAGAIEAAAAAYEARFGRPPRAVRPCAGAPAEASRGEAVGEPADEKGAPPDAPQAERPALSPLAEAYDASLSPDAHAGIIRGLLRGTPGATPSRIEAVVAMHGGLWRAEAGCGARGARVRLIRLEFDNLYCFGPGNCVDFTRLEGVVSGTVAPNRAGKSSLIEALLLALFEEHPRAATKTEVIRAGAPSCRLALDFEIDGRRGRIEKTFGRTKGRGSVYRLTYAGEDRTQGDIPATLREARALLGSPEVALATSVQLQGAETAGFVAARPLERRRLVATALELDHFSALERHTGHQFTALNGEARGIAKQFRGTTLKALEGALEAAASRLAAAEASAAAAEKEAAAAEERRGALMVEAAGRAACAAALEAPLGEWARAGRVGSETECLANRDAWVALLGDSPDIRVPAEASPRAEFRTRPPPARPAPEADQAMQPPYSAARVAAAEAAAAEATAAARKADRALALAEGARAAQVRGDSEAGAARQRLERQLTELEGPLPSLVHLFPGLPKPPAKPADPGPPFPGFAERCGPRPSASELEAALAGATSQARELRSDLAARARAADPRMLAELRADPTLQLPPRESVTEAATRVALLTEALGGFAPEALSVARGARSGRVSAESAKDASVGLRRLREEKGRLQGESLARSWLARSRESLRSGCSGCQEIGRLSEPAACLAVAEALAAAEQALPAAEAAAAEGAVAALAEAEEALTQARKWERLQRLEAAAAAAADLSALEAAEETISRENYWRARARESAVSVLAERNRWAATLRAAILSRKNALRSALDGIPGPPALAPSEFREGVGVAAGLGSEFARAQETAEVSAAAAAAAAATAGGLLRRRQEAGRAAAFWAAAAKRAGAVEAARVARAAADAAAKAGQAATDTVAEYRDALKQALARAAAARGAEADLRARIAQEAPRAAAAMEVEERLAVLRAYRSVLKPAAGIAAVLLEKARAFITREINACLRELGAPLEAELTPDFDLRQRDAKRPGSEQGPWLAASLASGYQRLVLGLAARLALWRLTAAPRLDALFVDEGFGACDTDHLESLGAALEALASAPGGPRLVFVVSHLDALKARLERALEIQPAASAAGSRVSNGRPSVGAPVAKELAPIPACDQKQTDAWLAPDKGDSSKLWCGACHQGLKRGNAARHLGSRKHSQAMRLLKLSAR